MSADEQLYGQAAEAEDLGSVKIGRHLEAGLSEGSHFSSCRDAVLQLMHNTADEALVAIEEDLPQLWTYSFGLPCDDTPSKYPALHSIKAVQDPIFRLELFVHRLYTLPSLPRLSLDALEELHITGCDCIEADAPVSRLGLKRLLGSLLCPTIQKLEIRNIFCHHASTNTFEALSPLSLNTLKLNTLTVSLADVRSILAESRDSLECLDLPLHQFLDGRSLARLLFPTKTSFTALEHLSISLADYTSSVPFLSGRASQSPTISPEIKPDLAILLYRLSNNQVKTFEIRNIRWKVPHLRSGLMRALSTSAIEMDSIAFEGWQPTDEEMAAVVEKSKPNVKPPDKASVLPEALVDAVKMPIPEREINTEEG